jgi:hypothetical protein
MNKELIVKGDISPNELESLKGVLNKNISLSRYESIKGSTDSKLQIFYKDRGAELVNTLKDQVMSDLKMALEYFSSKGRIIELVSLEFELENEIALNMVTIPEALPELFKQAKSYVTPEFLKNVERGNSLHLTFDQENILKAMVF